MTWGWYHHGLRCLITSLTRNSRTQKDAEVNKCWTCFAEIICNINFYKMLSHCCHESGFIWVKRVSWTSLSPSSAQIKCRATHQWEIWIKHADWLDALKPVTCRVIRPRSPPYKHTAASYPSDPHVIILHAKVMIMCAFNCWYTWLCAKYWGGKLECAALHFKRFLLLFMSPLKLSYWFERVYSLVQKHFHSPQRTERLIHCKQITFFKWSLEIILFKGI